MPSWAPGSPPPPPSPPPDHVRDRTTEESRCQQHCPVPTADDRFSFGLWTVGWQGVDVFGGPVRPPMDPVYAVERLAGIGAAALSFHDDDLVPDDARDR